ncbi:CoA ester lyase [Pseudomonas sp. PNP]|uniref:HpcH/HpaI aldolase/citrate lyase family protein n=1 Tax=Pseudomonas sp. PNP TaxID=361819 RepID=UPI001AED0FAC|nr:CoA ester lyase [Pseudomonas sp. PNP]MBP2839283.1 CoA ester lyase [Pseudomonas sp. PNP]
MLKTSLHALIAPLFVPGDRAERFAKAADSGADAVILDLEDAVAPAARASARLAVTRHGIEQVPVVVRINATSTEDFLADMIALRNTHFDAVMLAKAETAADVGLIHDLLGRQVPVIPLVETANAFNDLAGLLRAPGVVQAAFGSLDLALDLGCQPDWQALAWCRGALVLQSRLAGLAPPLDGVCTRIDDPDQVTADARHACDLGFGGKLLIHPRQVVPVREAFLPDDEALRWARAVVTAIDSGAAIKVDGAMVDRPLIERAQRILSQSSSLGETQR